MQILEKLMAMRFQHFYKNVIQDFFNVEYNTYIYYTYTNYDIVLVNNIKYNRQSRTSPGQRYTEELQLLNIL